MCDDDWDAPLDEPRENETRTNLIINYLPQSMTDEDFFSLFVTCGPIVSAKIIRDPNTGYSFGYGFVTFEQPEDAVTAITTYGGFGIQNKTLKVSYSRPKSDNVRDTNLYICNLGPDVTEDALDEVFSPFGRIITRNVLRDKVTGQPKGAAFVRFAKKEEAQAAIANLNGCVCMPHSDQQIEVRVALEHGGKKRAINSAVVSEFGSSGDGSGFQRGGYGGRGGNFYGQVGGGFSGGRGHNRFNPMRGNYDGGSRGFSRGRGFSGQHGRGRPAPWATENEQYGSNSAEFY